MPAPAPADTEPRLDLALADLGHLFNAPHIDPLSSTAPEQLGVSGVNHLVNLLYMDSRLRRVRTLVLHLPEAKASAAAAAAQTQHALHRHATARIEQLRHDVRDAYRYGWRATVVALVLLAACIALSSLFTSDLTEGMRPLLRTTFEYGFEIIGWVILWNPVDLLVFTPLPLRARIRAFEKLGAMEVVIRGDLLPAE